MVRGDVHLRRVDGGRDARHHVGRVAADDEQPAVEALVEGPQAAVEHGPPGRPRRAEQGRVQHEQREPAPRGVGGGEERRLVAHPQVTAEPDDGGAVGRGRLVAALMARR